MVNLCCSTKELIGWRTVSTNAAYDGKNELDYNIEKSSVCLPNFECWLTRLSFSLIDELARLL